MDEDGDEPVLSVCPITVIIAALVAKDYLAQGYTDPKAKIAAHRQLALDWLDWAVCESDLGRELAEAKAQAALTRKGGGNITIGKP